MDFYKTNLPLQLYVGLSNAGRHSSEEFPLPFYWVHRPNLRLCLKESSITLNNCIQDIYFEALVKKYNEVSECQFLNFDFSSAISWYRV